MILSAIGPAYIIARGRHRRPAGTPNERNMFDFEAQRFFSFDLGASERLLVAMMRKDADRINPLAALQKIKLFPN